MEMLFLYIPISQESEVEMRFEMKLPGLKYPCVQWRIYERCSGGYNTPIFLKKQMIMATQWKLCLYDILKYIQIYLNC
jgi:hypothetical protein